MAPVRMATGLVATDGGVDAFAEAASRAQLGLGGAPADLVAVFAGGCEPRERRGRAGGRRGAARIARADGLWRAGRARRRPRARAGGRGRGGGVARWGRGAELPPRAARNGRRRPRDSRPPRPRWRRRDDHARGPVLVPG